MLLYAWQTLRILVALQLKHSEKVCHAVNSQQQDPSANPACEVLALGWRKAEGTSQGGVVDFASGCDYPCQTDSTELAVACSKSRYHLHAADAKLEQDRWAVQMVTYHVATGWGQLNFWHKSTSHGILVGELAGPLGSTAYFMRVVVN